MDERKSDPIALVRSPWRNCLGQREGDTERGMKEYKQDKVNDRLRGRRKETEICSWRRTGHVSLVQWLLVPAMQVIPLLLFHLFIKGA